MRQAERADRMVRYWKRPASRLAMVALLLFGATEAAAAQASVQGRVRNARTNEPVPGATVLVVGTRNGAVADDSGRYDISGIAAGQVRLRARFAGFEDRDEVITLVAGETRMLDFRLEESITTLGAMLTEARSAERDVFEARPNLGVTMLSAKAMSSVPRLLGESDVLRAAQLMPGVLARNDFTAGLNVRGGEADQNLILLDGYPIFNPFHLGGLFGIFIEGSVSGLELRTGGFPAPFGGRLSSVLDVKSAEEGRPGVHGSGTVSMLATSGALGGSLADGKLSWMIAGRRTYVDRVLRAFAMNYLPYYFKDRSAHVAWRPFSRTRLSATLYDGLDNMTGDLATANDAAGGGNFHFFWGNRVAGVTLEQRLTDSLTFQQRLSRTQFHTALDIGDPASGASTIRLDDSVTEVTVAGSLELRRGAHVPSIGYSLSRDHLAYVAGSETAGLEFVNERQRPTSASGYVNDVWRPSRELMLEGGLRYEWLEDSHWHAVSPRLAAKYFLNDDAAVTAAVGRYTQWLHSLAREDIPVRLFDFWTASDSEIDVARATHYVLGGERWFGTARFARLETYVKQYDRLLEPNPFEEPERHGDEYTPLTGRSYGADLLLRQLDRGRWSGWLAYTYTFSTRASDTARFYPGQDRRHNANVVLSYRKSPKTLLSARLGFASGTPYTYIVGQLRQRTYDINTGRWDTEGPPDVAQVVGGPRNAMRLPPTQRLDVTVTREMRKGVTFTPFLSIMNLYNAHNVFMYDFNYEASPPKRTAYSQIPFFPSIGVTITW
jgi:hypothetical protein